MTLSLREIVSHRNLVGKMRKIRHDTTLTMHRFVSKIGKWICLRGLFGDSRSASRVFQWETDSIGRVKVRRFRRRTEDLVPYLADNVTLE